MKSNEEYINDYLDQYNHLKAKNELWRLKLTLSEFIIELDKIRAVYKTNLEQGYYNEYSCTQNAKSQVAVLLMEILSYQEMKAQIKRVKQAAAKQFKEEAPKAQAYVRSLSAPLLTEERIKIYRYLLRHQVTLQHLKAETLEEFKQSREFSNWQKRKK